MKKLGYDWRAAIVPGTSLWQIFVHDPSGVMMELTFDGKAENRPTPEIPADRVYMAGQPFGNAEGRRRRRRRFAESFRDAAKRRPRNPGTDSACVWIPGSRLQCAPE